MRNENGPGAERLHGLDSLRAGALLLGVVLHATMSFFPIPLWIISDNDPSPVASGIFFVIHTFRMITFFLLAGFFAHLALHRKGLWRFVRDRLVRIAGPLFTFWPIIFPAIVVVVIWAAWVRNGGSFPEDSPPPPSFSVTSFPLTHLWFLWVLLIFYAGLLIARAPFALLDRSDLAGRLTDRAVSLVTGIFGPFVLAVPLAVALYLTPGWTMWFGIPTPDQSLIPNLPALAGFGIAFSFGFLLHRQRSLLDRLRRQWLVLTALGLVSMTAAMSVAGGAVPNFIPAPDDASKALQAALYAFTAFSGTFACLSLTLRFLGGHSPVRRYLADASYWMYIVHMPIIMAGQVLVSGVEAPWWLKLGGLLGVSVLLMLVSYELIVRHTFIGRFLNGKRIPWRRPKASANPSLSATEVTQS